MSVINPLLLAGPEQILKYQEQRVKEWTEKKGHSRDNFDHYFSEILNQWEMDDFNETILDINEFENIDGIDLEASVKIQSELKRLNLLSNDGYLNLKSLNYDSVFEGLNDFAYLTNEQKESIAARLDAMLENKPSDFETFTKSMFFYTPTDKDKQNFAISESESKQIWTSLNSNNIIDDYGVLLLKPKSDELKSAINQLAGLSNGQKERVLAILNQHPELSYHSYLNNFGQNADPANPLPKPGIYFADGAPLKKVEGLTKEELNYIRIMAVLEWNVMLISQKSIHKTRKNSIEKVKNQKKAEKLENEKFLAQLEARYKEQSKKKPEKKK